jgi:hypothetical protein
VFYSQVLPAFAAGAAGPDVGRSQALLAEFKQVADKPSFTANLIAFCGDCAHNMQQ